MFLCLAVLHRYSSSVVDDKTWSFLWVSCIYSLLECRDTTSAVPPPILRAGSLLVLEAALHPIHVHASPPMTPLAITVPTPHEDASLCIRRRKGFSCNKPPRDSNKLIAELMDGVEEVKEYLFLFSASVDGVAVFVDSSYNNSVYFFSVFCENLPRRFMSNFLDGFYVVIAPCSSSANVDRSFSGHKVDTIFDTLSGKNQLSPTRRVRDGLSMVSIDLRDACPGAKMANQDFHHIMAEVLRSIKEDGKTGFGLRVGRTLFRIKYALVDFRADMPAANFLTGFSGRLSSVQPCVNCSVRRRVYDPYACIYMPTTKLSQSPLRSRFTTVNSSMTCLEVGHPLRFLRSCMWMNLRPENEEVFDAAISTGVDHYVSGEYRSGVKGFLQSEDYKKRKALMKSVISFLPPGIEVTLADDIESFPTYPIGALKNQGAPDGKKETMDPAATQQNRKQDQHAKHSWILMDYTYLSTENGVAIDMMHIFHNLFDSLVYLLFVDTIPKDLSMGVSGSFDSMNETAKAVMVNRELLEKKALMSMASPGSRKSFISVSQTVRKKAQARLSLMCKHHKLPKWTESLLNGKPFSARAEEKICFCNSVLPFVMMDSMENPKVWTTVTLFSVLATIYNHNGSIKVVKMYVELVHICLCILEMETEPQFSSPCFHRLLHLDNSFVTSGPLKGSDAFHCEGFFLGTSDEATGGKMQVATMHHRLIVRCSAKLIAFDDNADPRLLRSFISGDMSIMNEGNGVVRATLRMVTVINWLSDKARRQNDLFPQLSFLDLLLNGWLRDYNAKTLKFGGKRLADMRKPYLDLSYDDVKQFYDDVMGSQRCFFRHFFMMGELIWNNVRYCSTACNPKDLELHSFKPGCFGVVYSITERSHLFMIASYVGVCYKEKLYIQALGYELPTRPLRAPVDSPFAFKIALSDLRDYHRQPVLISLHRLVVSEIRFEPIDNNEIFCGVSAVCLRQWKTLHHVMVTPTEDCLKLVKAAINHKKE